MNQSCQQRAESVVHAMLEDIDPDNPERYVDAFAEGRDFLKGSEYLLRDSKQAYLKLRSDGVFEMMQREWSKKHENVLDDTDFVEGIISLVADGRGWLGPHWVKKWLGKHANNYF